MARVDIKTPRGIRLAGELQTRSTSALTLLAHGFTSDRRSRGRFPQLQKALGHFGISSLAIDFGGCGESDDEPLTLEGQVEDLQASVAWARKQGFGPIGIHAHSLGGLIALRAQLDDVRALVLTGAPLGPMRYDWSVLYSPEQLDELAKTAQVVSHRPDDALRKKIVVTLKLLKGIEEVDQAALVAGMRVPPLFIYGDGDDEERDLLRVAQSLQPKLPAGSKIAVIPGAPHGFGDKFERVCELAVAHFAAKLT